MRRFKINEVKKRNEGFVAGEDFIEMADNYMTRILEIYKNDLSEKECLMFGTAFKEKQLEEELDEIIKVGLPTNENESREILNNGLIFNGVKYKYLSTSAGLMKACEDNVEGEVFFIKEDMLDFKTTFEDIISLGKLDEATFEDIISSWKLDDKKNTEICINKDVISRISLALSDGENVHIEGMKRIVLPEMTYKFISNYKQFIEKDGSVDLEKFELEDKSNEEVEHIAFDGSGFIMPNIIDEVQNKLKLDYELSWIGVREIGLASKGLLVRFDFKKYLKDEHGIDKLIVKDMWGTPRNLFDYDVVMNESQCKWGKLYNSYEEYEQLKSLDRYSKYNNLFNGFNIVKTSTREDKIKKYTETNYQILSNLALNQNELAELSSESEDIYGRVLKQDVDATKLMLGDVAVDGMTDLSASTKVHKLLQLDEDMINIQSMYKVVGSMVNKKVNNLAGGNVYVKGGYKVILKDAISYMDSLVKGEYIYEEDKLKGIKGYMSDKGLQDKQNYVPTELGNRTLARCPLNSATELVKTELVSNELYNKYFGELSSDICFYPFNDFMMLQSGADEDLDISFVINNETIYNSVIEDIDENGTTWSFRNQFDGAKPSVKEYNESNLYESILEGRGNSIGSLSNKGAIISNMIQTIPYRIGEDLYDYQTIIDIASQKISDNNSRLNEKEVNKSAIKQFNELLEEGTIENILDCEVKDIILNNFQKYKKYSYYLLVLQMIAIDLPKTGLNVSKEQLEKLKDAIEKGTKKPRYIYYAKFKTENKQVDFLDTDSNNSLLCNHSKRIIKSYGAKAREMEHKKYNNSRLNNLLKNVKCESIEVLENLLAELVSEYHLLRDNIEVSKEIKELQKEYKELQDALADEEFLATVYEKLIPLYALRNKEYDKIDIIIQDKYNNTIKNVYGSKEILKALGNAKFEDKRTPSLHTINLYKTMKKEIPKKYYKIQSRFVIEFCFEELVEYLSEKCEGLCTSYKLSEKGDINYLFQTYSKVKIPLANVDLTEAQRIKQMQGLEQICKVRIAIEGHNELTDTIEVKDNIVYNDKNEVLGKLFNNFEGALKDEFYSVYKYDFKTVKISEYKDANSMSIFINM